MFNFYSELLLRLQKQFVSEHESDFKSIEDFNISDEDIITVTKIINTNISEKE